MTPPAEPTGSRLTFTRQEVRGGWLVRLSGTIDESMDRAAMIQGLSGSVVFDLDGVKRITSFGVREWVNAIKALQADDVCYSRAHPVVMTQFNLVANFAGRGQLVSFYAPYLCGSCGEDVEHFIDLRKDYELVKSGQAPEVKCPKCGAQAEFDDVPDVYFSYAASAPQPNPSPIATALLDGTPLPATPFKAEKDVHSTPNATVTAFFFSGTLDQSAKMKRLGEGLEGEVVASLSGVDGVTPEGFAQLDRFLETAAVPVVFARAPLDFIWAWTARPSRPPGTSLVSAWVRFECVACTHRIHLEANREVLAAGRLAGAQCPRDGQPLVCNAPAADLQRAAEALSVTCSRQILDYLAAHQTAPKRDRGSGSGSGSASQGARTPGHTMVGAPPAEWLTDSKDVFGRYQILRQLGRGGMAEVFLARQLGVAGFSKVVVLKRILESLGTDENFVSMFFQEARLAARISHPNVVQIFDLGAVEGRYFIAMEYVKGADLAFLLHLCTKLNQPMPVEIAARIMADTAAGLHAAHTSVDDDGRPTPIIHRDVSPHNVLLSHAGLVKLSDFGIAKASDTGNLTPSHTVKGKITYMAPEQAKSGDAPIDCRADLFPLGLMFFQALTLRQMFRREAEYATLYALLNDPIQPLTPLRPDAPRIVDDLLFKVLARDPAKRHQTAEEVRQDFEKVIAATGKPAGAAQVADWLRDLLNAAKAAGLVAQTAEFTPTGSAGNLKAPKSADSATVVIGPDDAKKK